MKVTFSRTFLKSVAPVMAGAATSQRTAAVRAKAPSAARLSFSRSGPPLRVHFLPDLNLEHILFCHVKGGICHLGLKIARKPLSRSQKVILRVLFLSACLLPKSDLMRDQRRFKAPSPGSEGWNLYLGLEKASQKTPHNSFAWLLLSADL